MTRLLILLLGLPAVAAAAADPTWPCVRRLVPTIAPAMVWPGELPDSAKQAPEPEIAALAKKLADGGTPVDAATAEIAAFADTAPPAERIQRLQQLFLATLDQINGEREQVVAGIRRYAQRQQQLAAQIADSGRQIDAQAGALPAEQLDQLRSQRQWDIRIYDQREKLLRQVCDQPVQLEQRAYALGRAIAAKLPQ